MSGDGRGRRVAQGLVHQRDYRDTARVALRAHQADLPVSAPPPRWAWLRRALATRPAGRSARADRRGSRLTGRSGFRSIFRVLFISSQTFARLLLFSPDLWRRRRVAIHSRVPMYPVRVRACAMSGDGRGRRVVQGFQLQRDYRDTARVALQAHRPVSPVRRPARAPPPRRAWLRRALATRPAGRSARADRRGSRLTRRRAGRRRCAMGGVRARAVWSRCALIYADLSAIIADYRRFLGPASRPLFVFFSAERCGARRAVCAYACVVACAFRAETGWVRGVCMHVRAPAHVRSARTCAAQAYTRAKASTHSQKHTWTANGACAHACMVSACTSKLSRRHALAHTQTLVHTRTHTYAHTQSYAHTHTYIRAHSWWHT